MIFSGTLRFNIDPSDLYSEADVWTALEHAHLKSFISGLAGTLDYECGEDGGNLRYVISYCQGNYAIYLCIFIQLRT